MKIFLQQLKWQFMLLARNNIVSISIAVTVVYGLLLFLLKDIPNLDKVLILIILNDPAIIGLFFIGLGVIIEKRDAVLAALFVSPMDHHVYLISRILSLSLLGLFCALGMVIALRGFDFNIPHLCAGVFGICLLCCLVGVWMVSYTQNFMSFLLWSIPILLFFVNMPMLNFFGIVESPLFGILPTQGALDLIIRGFGDTGNLLPIPLAYAAVIFWCGLLYFLIYRIFMKKMVNS